MGLILAFVLAVSTVPLQETAPASVAEKASAPVGEKAPTKIGGTAKITAENAYYDRKEGYVFFSGRVFVEDAKYQLHADRAYVFMDGTNELRRIVALGSVAMTNELKRAYGAKVSYYRNPGMVVLYSGDGRPAEVREEKPDGPQVVRGKKIKFWTESEQVEVIEADIAAPRGAGDLKKGALGL